MHTVRAYIRVSTTDQSGGVATQRAQLEAAITRDYQGYTVVWYVDEGWSGASAPTDRPAFISLVSAIQSDDVVLAYRRDRIARDVMHIMTIERLFSTRYHARIVTLEAPSADDPQSRLMRGLLDLFATYERELIRCRTIAGVARRKASGLPVGGATHTRYRIRHPDSYAAIRDMHDSGMGYRAIAHRLTAMPSPPALPSPRTTNWTWSSVRHILTE